MGVLGEIAGRVGARVCAERQRAGAGGRHGSNVLSCGPVSEAGVHSARPAQGLQAGAGLDAAVGWLRGCESSYSFMLFVALGLVQWLTMARIVRGQVLSIKSQNFVEAARALGASDFTIIFRHIVPNTLGPVILQEAFLSFFGLGVQPSDASWGTLVADGARLLALFPWLVIFPGAALSLTLMCFNFLGDGLRDALDPQDKRDVA